MDGVSEGSISFGGCRALGSEAQTDGRMNFRIEDKGRLGDEGLGLTIELEKGGSGGWTATSKGNGTVNLYGYRRGGEGEREGRRVRESGYHILCIKGFCMFRPYLI